MKCHVHAKHRVSLHGFVACANECFGQSQMELWAVDIIYGRALGRTSRG